MRKSVAVATAVFAIACALSAGFAGWWWWTTSGPRLPTESAVATPSRPDALPVLVVLAPGTIVDGPPPGWSHPIIKSVLHLASGDIATLPRFAKTTATKFRTVILADVRRDEQSGLHLLRRVGAALCLTREGRDEVISGSSLKEQGVQIGTIDAMVLGRAERALGRSRLAATTPTFALYDSHVEHADEAGEHHSILLRYAILVDPGTGSTRTACWTMAARPEDRQLPEAITLLPDNLIFRCGIHVHAHRVVGNFASSWGFAMTDLPPGETIPLTPALREMALLDPEILDSSALERAVREALGDRPAPPPPR